jgi:hypothetical protein
MNGLWQKWLNASQWMLAHTYLVTALPSFIEL